MFVHVIQNLWLFMLIAFVFNLDFMGVLVMCMYAITVGGLKCNSVLSQASVVVINFCFLIKQRRILMILPFKL